MIFAPDLDLAREQHDELRERLSQWSRQEGWDRARFPFGVYRNPAEMRADIAALLTLVETAERKPKVRRNPAELENWIGYARKVEAERDAALARVKELEDERVAMIGAIGEPCAECGHIDWRADPNEYLFGGRSR